MIETSLLKPGLRLAVGLSGGADSVALLRVLAERSRELGLVLHAAHLHHGLRGAEADADREFCRELAEKLGLPFHESQVDTGDTALADRGTGKAAETIEEAARRLRYGWFRELMGRGVVDAVATAHTRDDQAETVLAKFLRGAWTEGLSGIHPVMQFTEGRILRPLLGASRAEIEAYLGRLGQGWREDSSNRHLSFTRNRIRHELLPVLEEWNPRLRERLVQMAELARDEEAWWRAELERLGPKLILPGRPVRGGGRAAGDGLAIEVARLAELPVAVQRRVLRYAAGKLGAAPDFESTEALREVALAGRAGQKRELAQGLRGERTHRELRLRVGVGDDRSVAVSAAEYTVEIPGEIVASEWGIRVGISVSTQREDEKHAAGAKALSRFGGQSARLNSCPDTKQCADTGEVSGVSSIGRAVLRSWKAGDRVRLRHSGGPRKVKEVLERLRVYGSARARWPVVELNGRIVWMQGVELEPEPGVVVSVSPLDEPGSGASKGD
jgi:tRNA(Ile)-lysidine synthase